MSIYFKFSLFLVIISAPEITFTISLSCINIFEAS